MGLLLPPDCWRIWSTRVEGAEMEDRIRQLWVWWRQERTSVNQLNFLPGDRGYIGLGSLGTSPNLHKVVCMLLSRDFVCDSRVLWPSSEYRS